MFQKFKRKNPNKIAVFGTPPPLAGGVFAFGKIGGAKTTSLLSLCQKYHDNPERRYKIIDLYGGERQEETYWCFPSQDINYWKKLERNTSTKFSLATAISLCPFTKKLMGLPRLLNVPEIRINFGNFKIFSIKIFPTPQGIKKF